MTAIYYKDIRISYKELLQKIEETEITDPIFPVTRSVESVIKILTCFIKKIPFLPYSNLLPKKPEIKIPQDCDFLLHTSGSVKMKYALFRKSEFIDSNIHTHRRFMLSSKDIYSLNLPLYHVAGLSILIRSFLRGSSIAIDPINPSIVTHMSIVPTMAYELLKTVKYQNLKGLLLGGALIKEYLANQLLDFGYPLYITYGMTEMSSHIFVTKYRKENGVTFRTPLKGRIVKLNKEGVLSVMGRGKFIRYLDSSASEFHQTNDVFKYDNRRYKVASRNDQVCISGGENIDINEIKDAIKDIDGISKIQIEIKNDFKWGQRPYVKIYCREKQLSKQDIQSKLKSKIKKIMIPKDHEITLYS